MIFKSEMKDRQNFIESKIEVFNPKEYGYQKTIFEAMNYSMKAGGKRIRPIILMESYKICGGKEDIYIPFSAAIEMIHTYSLIHDDLPALDNDDLRRGMLTNHKKFGEATAILAGDALLTNAFEVMLTEGLKYDCPERVLAASCEIAKAAGVNGMIAGQVVDVESEGQKIDKDKLDFIHKNKTAAIIYACAKVGAILSGCDQEKIDAMGRYGEKIGLAFQIVDDILDIEGDEKLLGKHVGSDIENDKSTYPSLIGLDKSKEVVSDLIKGAKSELEIFSEEKEFLCELADYIMNRSS
ncbi:polyprenyl synthetase family protein [Peptostreptococcus faecalis]|uniref:polyprenyl synthetase family protein n=1 Tax=Peptostreptococcus faecalis TaxID=2045015 RepID=UPI000C7A22CE|nr:farnesyl diphosphate synthase [Peptostreptococcus faecalis]